MNSAFFVGGVRSGKSMLAQRWAENHSSHNVFVATAVGRDQEMRDRIAAHKAMRGANWTCLEEPVDISAACLRFLAAHPRFKGVFLIDCLSMWVCNMLELSHTNEEITQAFRAMLASMGELDSPCVWVSAECGAGFVPLDPLARRFGDVLGEINQLAAALTERVFLVCCGLSMPLKHPS